MIQANLDAFPLRNALKGKLRQQNKMLLNNLSNSLRCQSQVVLTAVCHGPWEMAQPCRLMTWSICVMRFNEQRAKHETHLGLIRGDPFAQAIRHNVISANRVAAIPGLILSNYIFYCCNTHTRPEMGLFFVLCRINPRSPPATN